MNAVQLEDCRNLGNLSYIDWDKLKDSTMLITGSTGLIGSNFVNTVAYNNKEKNLNIKLILPVRNAETAKRQFDWTSAEIVPYELGTLLPIDASVDYVIHMASPTSSKFFSEKPVDTMLANIAGHKALLDWAVMHPVKKFITLSSMEVYGFPEKGCKVKEKDLGSFETMNARNSYPIAKIASETLCYAYHAQYGIPVVILRLTQTFGPGVKYDDGRVFAQFMRCAIEKADIVLKTAGLTERSYLYTADAVSAILISLLKAEPGQAYSVANKTTYCSIRAMAEMVADEIAGGKINVVFDMVDDVEKLGYAGTLFMDLDVEKIECLGWEAKVGLREMYERMMRGIPGNA